MTSRGVESEKFRKPRFQDIAEEAGVGTATVERVLNGRANVLPRTAQRVIIAARKLGYDRTLPSAYHACIQIEVVIVPAGHGVLLSPEPRVQADQPISRQVHPDPTQRSSGRSAGCHRTADREGSAEPDWIDRCAAGQPRDHLGFAEGRRAECADRPARVGRLLWWQGSLRGHRQRKRGKDRRFFHAQHARRLPGPGRHPVP